MQGSSLRQEAGSRELHDTGNAEGDAEGSQGAHRLVMGGAAEHCQVRRGLKLGGQAVCVVYGGAAKHCQTITVLWY
jgi:hypothetical protein